MAEIVRMPKLSDTMTDGVVAKWHKKVGDKIKSGDLLADIETDKATMEFESFQDGVLLHIGVPEKGTVPVDALIAILGKEGEDISALLNGGGSTPAAQTVAPAASVTAPAAAAAALPAGVEVVRMPKLSDTMTDGVLAKWHKKVGDKVKSGDLLADIETDKATMEFESFQDGVLLYQGVAEGASTAVDGVIAILGKGGEDVNAILATVNSSGASKAAASSAPATSAAATPAVSAPAAASTLSTEGGRVKASPLAKAMAKERGIDLSKVKGSAENGRITKADIENYKPGASSGSASTAAPVITGAESFVDEPASQMRKTIAKRLSESLFTAPHFYLKMNELAT
jgi:pyruvate dehydrogenase E2 component (dihydrolipoamide acetyltransferase)